LSPNAAFRSNFIVGYPGETEDDQAEMAEWIEAAQLDWCGLFTYSNEAGTYAADLPDQIPVELMRERHQELSEIQDSITAVRRDELIGSDVEVLVDEVGVGRSHREAPEIDGIISVPEHLDVGQFHTVRVTSSDGPDLVAE
jgi:ribosomal protein S12 methylthiotransferase